MSSENVKRLEEEADFQHGMEKGEKAGLVNQIIDQIPNLFESEAFRSGYNQGTKRR